MIFSLYYAHRLLQNVLIFVFLDLFRRSAKDLISDNKNDNLLEPLSCFCTSSDQSWIISQLEFCMVLSPYILHFISFHFHFNFILCEPFHHNLQNLNDLNFLPFLFFLLGGWGKCGYLS